MVALRRCVRGVAKEALWLKHEEPQRRSRSRNGSEGVNQRGPAPLRTTRSDSDPLHHRPLTDPDENQNESDVFEVPIEMVAQTSNRGDVKTKESNISRESPEKPRSDEALTALTTKNEEVSLLKLKIEETEKNLEAFRQENDGLKRQLSEANMN
ncbi:hypothetical protein L2E82_48413 [Cichorium intybus]|uniref:Uncharacterized protein n=1 Tax=Cichorium intybus TaxID=13427 RepID=A0ACB8YXA3_CICIN|nr:hypothetical protein L2E82_48413 [Cichorium intybus]